MTNPFLVEFEKRIAFIEERCSKGKCIVHKMRETGEVIEWNDNEKKYQSRKINGVEEFKKLRQKEIDSYYEEAVVPLVNAYAWAIPTEIAIRTIAKYGPIIEIGAGNGYWAYLLGKAGANVIAFDNKSWNNIEKYQRNVTQWFDVKEGNEAMIPQHPQRNLFLCYPPGFWDYPLASKCLFLFRGSFLIYIGGEKGGPTGDDVFFHILNSDFDMIEEVPIPHWPDHYVSMKIFRRKMKIIHRQFIPLGLNPHPFQNLLYYSKEIQK